MTHDYTLVHLVLYHYKTPTTATVHHFTLTHVLPPPPRDTVPPSGISLVGQSDGSVVEVVAGASLTLRCRVPDARPPPKLLWYLDEKQLPAGGITQIFPSLC